jgi:hypothetical protein
VPTRGAPIGADSLHLCGMRDDGRRPFFSFCTRLLRRRLSENSYRMDVIIRTERDQNELGDQPRRYDAEASDGDTEHDDDDRDQRIV